MGNYIKIAYFPSTSTREQVLGSNGKNITNYCTKCVTTENNNNYVLDATFTLEASEYLDEENILKVKMDYGYEIFRISKVTKSLRYIDIVARQITISDTLTMWLDDVRPTSCNGQMALEHINNGATSRRKEIIFKSNITKESTAYYQDMNVYTAISDCDQSFINRWGGEILRRQYTLSINKRVGKESGVTIREGKNLIGFSGESSTDNLVTRAIGQGYNGIRGHYIDSPLINNYSNIYNSKIEYSDVRLKTDQTSTEEEGCLYFDKLEDAQKELDNRIAKEFSENDIDKVKATYSINFVELEKVSQYSQYSHAEKVMLGDTVRVYISKLGTDIKVRVISKQYDVLAEKTKEIKLSNEVIITAININTIISELQKVDNSVDNPVASYIDAMQRAGIQNSYVIMRENEFLALDTKDINTAKNVVKINNNGLFFSNNGYYGDYENGFTIDGIINANRIRAGILTAIQIQNADGSMVMDLGGTDGLIFRSKATNGGYKNDIRIHKNRIDIYNRSSSKKNNIVGTITSLRKVNDPSVTNIGIIHDSESAINIGYTYDDMDVKEDFENYSYITLDKFDNFSSNKGCPIKVKKNMALAAGCQLKLFVDNEKSNSGVVFMTSDDELCIAGLGGISLGILKDNGAMASKIDIKQDRIDVHTDLYINGTKVYPGTGGGGTGGSGTTVTGGTELQMAVVNSARKLIGLPYVYGGNYPPLGSDRGTDCSGLCQWAYNDNGISISRTTYTQITEGIEVYENDLQPADLIFTRGTTDNGHVFLYAGKNANGEHVCIEAQQTGTNIMERTFTWGSTYRARRIITS